MLFFAQICVNEISVSFFIENNKNIIYFLNFILSLQVWKKKGLTITITASLKFQKNFFTILLQFDFVSFAFTSFLSYPSSVLVPWY